MQPVMRHRIAQRQVQLLQLQINPSPGFPFSLQSSSSVQWQQQKLCLQGPQEQVRFQLLLTQPKTCFIHCPEVPPANGSTELSSPRRSVPTDAALRRLHVHNARDLASACGNIAPGKRGFEHTTPCWHSTSLSAQAMLCLSAGLFKYLSMLLMPWQTSEFRMHPLGHSVR